MALFRPDSNLDTTQGQLPPGDLITNPSTQLHTHARAYAYDCLPQRLLRRTFRLLEHLRRAGTLAHRTVSLLHTTVCASVGVWVRESVGTAPIGDSVHQACTRTFWLH